MHWLLVRRSICVASRSCQCPSINLWELKAVFLKSVDARCAVRQLTAVTRDVVQVVSATIRRIRLERGFSQEAFAQHAQLDRSYYGRIERGTQNIALRTLCVIAATLRVHPSELLADLTADDYGALKVPPKQDKS